MATVCEKPEHGTNGSAGPRPADDRQIADWLRLFVEPGQVVELRALDVTQRYGKPATVSGYFDYEHIDQLAKEALPLDGKATAVYFTLNPVNPDLLSRCANRVAVPKQGQTTSDTHIVRRKRLLIDADPVRVAGVSSTDAEKATAFSTIRAVESHLMEAGWQRGILADSGNGFHLIFLIDLPADDGDLVSRVLQAIAKRFDSDAVKIDQTVSNPARITKLYGTLARKGDNTLMRPHRRSRIVEAPDEFRIVERALLEKIAVRPAPPKVEASKSGKQTSGRANHRLKVAEWLDARHVAYTISNKADSRGRTCYVLADCPFNQEHKYHAAVMQGSDGKLSAACFHNGCLGKGWQDFKAAIGAPDRNHYDPPLPEKKKKAKVIIDPKTGGPFPMTDYGNAQRLVGRYANNIHYVYAWRKWLAWDKIRWRPDATGVIERCAKNTVRRIYQEAAAASDHLRESLAKHAVSSEDSRRISAMIALARSEPGVAIEPEKLDADPWAINCLNGTLNLRTGELREQRRSDLFSKVCQVSYDAGAKAPLWESFLQTTFNHDDALIDYIGKLAGYWLTGSVIEQILSIFWGVGANGKSTFLNTLHGVMGLDYAIKAASDLLILKRGDSHPTDKADLHGRRFVICSETDEGRHLAESLVKDLTGGERVRARRMREDFWEFAPTHKIVLCTNHKPAITGIDHAIWRRLHLVPFTTIIPDAEQDKNLTKKLESERAGILTWASAGCLRWQREGLGMPAVVKAATADYRKQQDALAPFLDECCRTGSFNYRAKASELYEVYKLWSTENGEKPESQTHFGSALIDRGCERYTDNGTKYKGIAVKELWLERLMQSAH